MTGTGRPAAPELWRGRGDQ